MNSTPFALRFLLPVLLMSGCGGGGDGPDGAAGSASVVGAGGASAVAGAVPPPAVSVETCSPADPGSEVLAAVNPLRAVARVCGATLFPAVGGLSWDARLAEAARVHSTDMAVYNFFDHTGSNASTVGMRVTAAGYSWTFVAENLAAGQRDLATALTGWMNSAGHCRNLMQSNVTQVGLACVRRSGNDQTPYWTMVLARPRS